MDGRIIVVYGAGNFCICSVMPVKPPKCRACGKEEWRHTCGGTPEIKEKRQPGRPKTSTPERRKAYLAQKAKEWRQRQKEKK